MKIKRRTKENLIIALLVLCFIVLQVATIVMNIRNMGTLNGVFAALQYGVCLLLVFINRKKGIRVSMVLLGISILFVTRSLIFEGNLNALPGLANNVFYVVTILIISKFYKKREWENISDYRTNSLNRRGLYKELGNRIGDKESFHVIYYTINNYKYINDNYGHAYGDELLRKIAMRINKKLEKGDSIARINGSDFVVILKKDSDVKVFADKLLASMKERAVLVVDRRSVDCYPECYGGIISYEPSSSMDAEALIKCADVATCEAIDQKIQEVREFSQEMMEKLNRQLEIEVLIKEGLDKNYFYMVYQPQYYAHHKHLRGFEALIRMKNPGGERISPGEFIPVAEKSELILAIDDYVLKRVMKDFKPIVTENPTIIVSANVSAKNICDPDFVDKVKKLLDMCEFPACNLEIEITEYCMVDSMDTTIANIKKLRDMDIQVALDDFGTGYTSLNYVTKMPINLLKIDKSLIDDISKDDKSKEFVQAVITMGHVMGCEVISEGVEDGEQLEYLRDNGCDYIQGYIWGKPLEYEAAKQLSLDK